MVASASSNNYVPPRMPTYPQILDFLRRYALRIIGGTIWLLLTLILSVLGVGSLIPGYIIALGVVAVIVFRTKIRRIFAVALGACLLLTLWRACQIPSNDRDWQPHFKQLSHTELEGNTVTIHNLRNFRWDREQILSESWESRQFPLDQLQGVDLIVEPFAYSDLMAHTMLSFDFGEAGWLTLSIEARKEVGEDYGPIKGGLNNFELSYLFLDERDAIAGRVSRGAKLYAYPLKVAPLQLRAFFLSLCTRGNRLLEQPAFYHIIRDNCTTSWLERADSLSNKPVGLQWKSVANGLIADVAFARQLVDTDLSEKEAKQFFRIDPKVAETDPNREDFSQHIRSSRRKAH